MRLEQIDAHPRDHELASGGYCTGEEIGVLFRAKGPYDHVYKVFR